MTTPIQTKMKGKKKETNKRMYRLTSPPRAKEKLKHYRKHETKVVKEDVNIIPNSLLRRQKSAKEAAQISAAKSQAATQRQQSMSDSTRHRRHPPWFPGQC